MRGMSSNLDKFLADGMKAMVRFFLDLVKLVSPEYTFCTVLQFASWYKLQVKDFRNLEDGNKSCSD